MRKPVKLCESCGTPTSQNAMVLFDYNDRNLYLNDVEPKNVGMLIELINKFNDYETEQFYKDLDMASHVLSKRQCEDLEKVQLVFNCEPLKLHISSYGGSAYDMLSLINVIKSSKVPIEAHILYSMSAGTAIASVCHYRIGYPLTRYMIHGLGNSDYGKLQEMKENMVESSWLEDTYVKILTEHTEIKESKLKQIIREKKDWYFDSELALKMGLIDEIAGSENTEVEGE